MDFGRKIAEGTPERGRATTREVIEAYLGSATVVTRDSLLTARRGARPAGYGPGRGAHGIDFARRRGRGRGGPRCQRRRQDDDAAGDQRDDRRASGEVHLRRRRSIAGKQAEDIVRLGIAHVPQGRGTIADLTVEENLRVGAYRPQGRRGRRRHRPLVRRCSRGWASAATRRPAACRGGEQQMLAIARALMSRPAAAAARRAVARPGAAGHPRAVRPPRRDQPRRRARPMLLVEQNANLALDIADRGLRARGRRRSSRRARPTSSRPTKPSARRTWGTEWTSSSIASFVGIGSTARSTRRSPWRWCSSTAPPACSTSRRARWRCSPRSSRGSSGTTAGRSGWRIARCRWRSRSSSAR